MPTVAPQASQTTNKLGSLFILILMSRPGRDYLWIPLIVDYSNFVFGFPLSIIKLDSLKNTDVTNHFSALQYPKAVTDYLYKEVKLGAILGRFDNIPYHKFHCSPLLTRPKELDKRRVKLNLSYPSSNSVNDKVTRHNNSF